MMMHKAELMAISNERLRRRATYASVGVALTLIAAKLTAYIITDSVAMLSSLLDSTVDLLASLVTVYGVASALRPPDREHRFGHGKAEPLAALAQAAFIVGSSVLLLYEALSRFYHPHDLQHEVFGYGVMGLAIALTLGLVQFQKYAVRQTGSIAIKADSMHYTGDLAINLAVIIAFALQQYTGLTWFDPVFAIGIAIALMLTAFHIARHALDVLMDRELPESDRAKIQAAVEAVPHVHGMHDMRTRSDSDRVFVEMHVELDPQMTLREAHHVSDNIINAVRSLFPAADVLVHQDPLGLEEERLDTRIEANAP
ncbi:MAG: cation diffusion facilitator family transporter [Alphaproteobacteria bacterium]|nr:cation diffusion facilitator family transporter [Alphaproteobacteria bacterium]